MGRRNDGCIMKLLFGFAILILAMWIAPVKSNAYTKIDSTQPISLKVVTPHPDFVLHLYQVADVSEYVEITLKTPFDSSSLSGDFTDFDQNAWQQAAQTLYSHALAVGAAPLETFTTNINGIYDVTGLTPGLYLLTGDMKIVGNQKYVPVPTLMVLPALDSSDSWVYAATANVKLDIENLDDYEYKVMKVWDDNGSTSRPAAVTVQLFKNGVLHSEVVLDQANNWRYSWYELDPAVSWTVGEKDCPAGYTATVTKDKKTYVITNKKDTPPPPTPEIPQTGQLWWPVPCLILGGCICIIIGLLKRRSYEDGKE